MRTAAKSWGVLLLLTVAFIIGRLASYGDLTDSVAANDTSSYFECAPGKIADIAYFECSRPPTIPLLIRFLNPENDYQISLMSEPFFRTEPRLATQKGTENLVIFQTLFSIFSWVLFTLLLISYLRHEIAKITLAILLYGFAFVPQIGDWDSILLSESLSFSFFVLMLAAFLVLMMNYFHQKNFFIRALSALLFLVMFTLWLFTRDTNSYLAVFIAILLIIVFLVGLIRLHRFYGILLIVSLCLSGLFAFQQITFRNSPRWVVPLLNNLTGTVFPYPERVVFFEERGMPVTPELLATTGSAEYNQIGDHPQFMAWVHKSGMRTYMAFLLDRPFWTLTQVTGNLDAFFEENIQPFFYGSREDKPHWAEPIGNLLHPLSASVILIDLLLLLTLLFIWVRRLDGIAFSWLIFCTGLVIGGIMLMSIMFLGEVRSIWRHVLGGVMPLRLAVWIMLAVLLDTALEIPAPPPIITRLGGSQTQLSSGKMETH